MPELNVNAMLQRWNLYIFFFVLVHFALRVITGFRINEYVIFSLKAFVCMTALILFLSSLKPINTIALYYSF
jgi:hypothetical protein